MACGRGRGRAMDNRVDLTQDDVHRERRQTARQRFEEEVEEREDDDDDDAAQVRRVFTLRSNHLNLSSSYLRIPKVPAPASNVYSLPVHAVSMSSKYALQVAGQIIPEACDRIGE